MVEHDFVEIEIRGNVSQKKYMQKEGKGKTTSGEQACG